MSMLPRTKTCVVLLYASRTDIGLTKCSLRAISHSPHLCSSQYRTVACMGLPRPTGRFKSLSPPSTPKEAKQKQNKKNAKTKKDVVKTMATCTLHLASAPFNAQNHACDIMTLGTQTNKKRKQKQKQERDITLTPYSPSNAGQKNKRKNKIV